MNEDQGKKVKISSIKVIYIHLRDNNLYPKCKRNSIHSFSVYSVSQVAETSDWKDLWEDHRESTIGVISNVWSLFGVAFSTQGVNWSSWKWQ